MEIKPVKESERAYNHNPSPGNESLYSKGKKGDAIFQETLARVNLASVVGIEITAGVHHVELSQEARDTIKKYN